MDIKIHTNGEAKCLLDHTNYKIVDGTAGPVFYDNPLTDIPAATLPINTSIGVQNLILHPEVGQELFESIISQQDQVSFLYGIFNGIEFTEFIEVNCTLRFMTGDIGPEIGFTTGAAFHVPLDDVKSGLQDLAKIEGILEDLKYRGFVRLGISEGFLITNISYGYFYGDFGLFCELCKNSVDEIIESALRPAIKLRFLDTISVGCLVTQYPFPVPVNENHISLSSLAAPKSAEKHLWRIYFSRYCESVLITSHGDSLQEARRRIRRTIDNMLRYNRNIQYRFDYGNRLNFLFSQDKYEKASGPARISA